MTPCNHLELPHDHVNVALDELHNVLARIELKSSQPRASNISRWKSTALQLLLPRLSALKLNSTVERGEFLAYHFEGLREKAKETASAVGLLHKAQAPRGSSEIIVEPLDHSADCVVVSTCSRGDVHQRDSQ